MGDQLAASASARVSNLLGDLCGMPVRLTILEPDSRDRVLRVPGILSRVTARSVTVECMRSVPPLRADVTASVEVMVDGSIIWFHTKQVADTSPGNRGEINLVLPETVQTLQRRRHPRVDVDRHVCVQLKRTGQVLTARLRDISAGGAAIRISEPISAGEAVELQFPLAISAYISDVPAETLRCVDADDGHYTVALQFRCTPEQEARIAAWVSNLITQESQAAPGAYESDVM